MPKLLMVFLLCLLTGWVQAEPSPALQTDAGRRWKIVPAMMAHLRAAEKALDSESASTVTDHRQMAERLDASLSALVASCTMSGPAHDELHKWLVPFLGIAKGYLGETDLALLAKRHEELRKEFQIFHKYFE